jgi:Tfp pilus assembly protein PilF
MTGKANFSKPRRQRGRRSTYSQSYIVWGNLVDDYEWLKQPDKVAEATRREIPLLEQAIQQHPRESDAYGRLADALSSQHDKEKALANLRSALALAPDDAGVLGIAADVYENLGDRRQAIEYVGKALHHGGTKDQFVEDPELQELLKDPAAKAVVK